MAPVSRRSFLAGLIAAPVLGVLAPKVLEMRPEYVWPYGDSFVTPNGETITAMEQVFGRLYVFTKSAVFVVPA